METGKSLPDPRCFYAWKTLDKAKDCAHSTSKLADQRYKGDDRKPVVIEFETPGKLFDFLKVHPDPESKPLGVKVRGRVQQIKTVYMLEETNRHP